jgi:hypothetical protein
LCEAQPGRDRLFEIAKTSGDYTVIGRQCKFERGLLQACNKSRMNSLFLHCSRLFELICLVFFQQLRSGRNRLVLFQANKAWFCTLGL